MAVSNQIRTTGRPKPGSQLEGLACWSDNKVRMSPSSQIQRPWEEGMDRIGKCLDVENEAAFGQGNGQG